MSWLSNFVRPKFQSLVGRKDTPENLWHKCPSCGQMIFHRELEKNLNVCQHCGHHLAMQTIRRLDLLFDEAKYEVMDLPDVDDDPLKFRDRKKYSDRIKDARSKAGTNDALVVASGTIGGNPVVIAAFNFAFMGGSMGTAVGEGFIRAARKAIEDKAAFIVIPASGGARMQEGILSLMQMARTTVATDEVKESGLPYIVLFTNPTTGGVSASFAMLGDIAIAEPGAVIGFAGARVIEQTIRESLPDGFQRAEYLLQHGMIDMVVPRKELRDTLASLIHLVTNPKANGAAKATLPAPDAAPEPTPEGAAPGSDDDQASENERT